MRLLEAHSAHRGFAAILAASVTLRLHSKVLQMLLSCSSAMACPAMERDVLSRGDGCSAVAAWVDRAVFEVPLLDPGVMWKESS